MGEKEDNEIPPLPSWLTWRHWIWAAGFAACLMIARYVNLF